MNWKQPAFILGFSIILGLLDVATVVQSSIDHFSYHNNDEFGSQNWPKHYKKCGGTHQSPINLDSSTAESIEFQYPLRTTNFKQLPLQIEIQNNGYTSKIHYSWQCCAPRIYGGPLDSVYHVDNAHCHWGNDSAKGSEHTIDGKSYAMECHIYFVNLKYQSKEEALKHKDGLAAMAFIYEEVPKTKSSSLFRGVRKISKYGDTARIQFDKAPSLVESFTGGKNMSYSYYTYEGSLTAPECNEAVQWIVLDYIFPISSKQMNYFRKLEDSEGVPLTDNFRELQPIGDRIIQRVI